MGRHVGRVGTPIPVGTETGRSQFLHDRALRLPVLNDPNLYTPTFGAFERAPIVIRLVVGLDANEPHRHQARRARGTADRRW
jgi:hypothetical protein